MIKVIMLSLLLFFMPLIGHAKMKDSGFRAEVKKVKAVGAHGWEYAVRVICYRGEEYLIVNDSIAKTGNTCVITEKEEKK